MGGSFNPPTIAHLQLMEAAVLAVGAEEGVFVPVGEAYLKRKMRRSEDPIRFDGQMRMEMLQTMCADRENFIVSDLEMLNPRLYTRETMQILQGQYPAAKLYFLAGADKLELLGSFAEKSDFLKHFGVVLFSREGTNAEESVLKDPRFALVRQAFVHVNQPESAETISSTAVRRFIANREAEKARSYLHDEVFKMIRHLTPDDFPVEIEGFKEKFAFLSNEFLSPVCYDGLSFTCAEAAFQAVRCAQESDRIRIAQGDGQRAKQIAARVEQRPDFEACRLKLMEGILRAKFSQNPALAERLKDTGNAVLIHISRGKDRYWGKNLYTDCGENHLGYLLMKLRKELQERGENHEIQP